MDSTITLVSKKKKQSYATLCSLFSDAFTYAQHHKLIFSLKFFFALKSAPKFLLKN